METYLKDQEILTIKNKCGFDQKFIVGCNDLGKERAWGITLWCGMITKELQYGLSPLTTLVGLS